MPVLSEIVRGPAFLSDDRYRILALVVSLLGAGVSLSLSRITAFALVPVIILLGLAVFLACNSRHRLFCLLAIGLFASLILSLRFEYLTWGDPWFEYGMIQRILLYQSLSPIVYPSQLPVLHVTVAALSLFSGVAPLTLLKYSIPALSVIGIAVVYLWTKEIANGETAFFAGLLLLSGTPYLHWINQGVRETLGITLFLLALYVSFRAIRDQKPGFIGVSLLLIIGIVLTHHLSALIFLGVWSVISLVYLYVSCRPEKIARTSLVAGIITTSTILTIVAWWAGRLTYEFSEFSGLANSISHSEYGILLMIVCLDILYLIPVMIPGRIQSLQQCIQQILLRKKSIYAVLVIGSFAASLVVLNFILGKSSFVLAYPPQMLFNGICIIIFSLIGLWYFLEKDRLYFIAWVAVLSLFLVFSMGNIFFFDDPLRLMEFLYIPLAVIAAFGLSWIARGIPSRIIVSVLVTVFVLISIVTAFPALVFFGQAYEPGHPMYDYRSVIIEHSPSEISAIQWLKNMGVNGEIDSDTYVGYSSRAVILAGNSTIQSEQSFISDEGYIHASGNSVRKHYLIILERMKNWMEFAEQWMKEKQPLNETALLRIDRDCNRLYDSGTADIYSYATL